MRAANATAFASAIPHVVSRSFQHDVEIHSIDTDAGIVLDAQIDVLLDAEAEISGIGKAVLSQLIFSHLEQRNK